MWRIRVNAPVLCNRYGLPIAVTTLGEFQRASEALVSVVILAERDFSRKFAQRTEAREGWVENGAAPALLLGRRSQRDMLPRRALAAGHFELNDCKGIPVTQHWLERLQPWFSSNVRLVKLILIPIFTNVLDCGTPLAMERVSLCAQN